MTFGIVKGFVTGNDILNVALRKWANGDHIVCVAELISDQNHGLPHDLLIFFAQFVEDGADMIALAIVSAFLLGILMAM